LRIEIEINFRQFWYWVSTVAVATSLKLCNWGSAGRCGCVRSATLLWKCPARWNFLIFDWQKMNRCLI
jgi:hypothetical protein